MRPIERLISAGFATAAFASASVPALAWTVWPDVDFQWYADVGRPVAAQAAGIAPEPERRAGYIWAPAHWERRGARETWVEGRWVKDEYQHQLAMQGRAAPGESGRDALAASPEARPSTH